MLEVIYGAFAEHSLLPQRAHESFDVRRTGPTTQANNHVTDQPLGGRRPSPC